MALHASRGAAMGQLSPTGALGGQPDLRRAGVKQQEHLGMLGELADLHPLLARVSRLLRNGYRQLNVRPTGPDQLFK